MTPFEFLQQERPLAIIAGIAGAAAMAATDWRSPWRFAQHLFVGTACSAAATPLFAPAISKLLGMIAVDPASHGYAAAFIVGAFGVYLLEYALAFWRHKIGRGDKDAGDA